MSGNRLLDELKEFRIIEIGRNTIFEDSKAIVFRTESQPAFNKNFELLADKLAANKIEGYQTYIISENQSQIDRLRDIFAEISPGAAFNALLLNRHSGFPDHALGISVFTDHQIFDRYHKFRIRDFSQEREHIH
jgi:transcription-repair coupling factor (superfamily II helicase)